MEEEPLTQSQIVSPENPNLQIYWLCWYTKQHIFKILLYLSNKGTI